MNEPTPLYQAMKAAVSQTLENMAFTEALEHYDQDYKIPADQLVWTSILIQDPVPGELRLAMPEAVLKTLTGAIFGLEEADISQRQMSDILFELLNTIAGLFMAKLLRDDQTFKLGLPEAGEGPLPELEENAIVWKLMTPEEHPLLLVVSGAPLVALNN